MEQPGISTAEQQVLFLEYLQNKYSSSSIKSYINMTERYWAFMSGKEIKASREDIVHYIGILRSLGLHPKSLRNHLFAIKIYYNFLVENGIRKDHPCRYMKLRDKINRQIAVERLYSKEELELFYKEYQSKDKKMQNRDKVIIGLLIWQGLTVSEVTRIKIADLDLENGTLFIESGKQNRERVLPLKPQQILLFYAYIHQDRIQLLENKEDQGYLVLSSQGEQVVSSNISRMINSKNRKNYLPIKIRQSVIANLLKEHHDLRIVQNFCGHRRTGSTEQYKQSGFEQLQEMIERIHPLGKGVGVYGARPGSSTLQS
jgi:integrase/recombinase XerD